MKQPISPAATKEVLAGMKQLSADLQANLTYTKLRSIVTMDLDVAARRLQQAVQFQQEPKEALRFGE